VGDAANAKSILGWKATIPWKTCAPNGARRPHQPGENPGRRLMSARGRSSLWLACEATFMAPRCPSPRLGWVISPLEAAKAQEIPPSLIERLLGSTSFRSQKPNQTNYGWRIETGDDENYVCAVAL
jgi:hypothetical protein